MKKEPVRKSTFRTALIRPIPRKAPRQARNGEANSTGANDGSGPGQAGTFTSGSRQFLGGIGDRPCGHSLASASPCAKSRQEDQGAFVPSQALAVCIDLDALRSRLRDR